MAEIYSRRATFDQVKNDMGALLFHKNRYENGSVDSLAKLSYQQWQLLKNNPSYKAKLEGMEKQ